MQKPFIVLASQSPRRSMLLRQAGYEFEVLPSNADELDATAETIHHIVEENARRKGRAVAEIIRQQRRSFPEDAVLLAADTLVTMSGRVYGKPIDLEEAERFLTELGGRPHHVLTGVYLYRLHDNRERVFHDRTQVTLKVLQPEELHQLFKRVNPLDKAAGYGFQDAADMVANLVGSASNVIGLPLERLESVLTDDFSQEQ